MRGLFLLVVALATVAVAPNTVLAGGSGGAKKTAWINVTNNSTVQVGVIVDINPTGMTPAQFLSKGGVVLPMGKPGKFHVSAGNHNVFVVYLDAAGNPTALVNKQYGVGKSQTLEVKVTDAGLSP
ncbi:MAG: hypothetical protein IT422_08240 [Pirellulaceae bacterium]|nr:hypothetical protein [Pirellulaceae bacterium]